MSTKTREDSQDDRQLFHIATRLCDFADILQSVELAKMAFTLRRIAKHNRVGRCDDEWQGSGG